MWWHALPKVDQEILDFVKVSSDHTVQDTLAVGTVHEEEGVHLERKEGGEGRKEGGEEGGRGGEGGRREERRG